MITLTWAPTRRPGGMPAFESKSIMTGKRCAARSQSRLFSIVGSAPRESLLVDIPYPTLRTRPLNTRPLADPRPPRGVHAEGEPVRQGATRQ